MLTYFLELITLDLHVIDLHCDKPWHFLVFASEEQLETRMDNSGTQ